MMILLSLSELSVDTMVSDLHSRVLSRIIVFTIGNGEKIVLLQADLLFHVWMEYRKVCTNTFRIPVGFSDEKCCIGSAV